MKKLIVMQSSPLSCYLPFPTQKRHPQHPVLVQPTPPLPPAKDVPQNDKCPHQYKTTGKSVFFMCFVDRASLCNLFQMKPNSCTLLLSIFISTSLHVLGNYVPIIRTTYCIYATLVFSIVYGWLSGVLVGMRLGGCLVCWLG
jgi:hypothetical protein